MLLEWTAPPECPNEQLVTSQVSALAGETLARQPLSVRARIVAGNEHRYRLELRVATREEDARVIESDDCQKLAEATALIVSLHLSSRAKSESKDVNVAPPPAAPLPPETRPPERAARRTHGGLGVDVSGDLGTLPTIAWGAGFRGYVSRGLLRGELGAMLWPRSEATAQSPFGGGASISLRTLALAGCWTWEPRLGLSGCFRVEGGILHASGFGISRPSTSNGLWLAGFAGLTARLFTWGAIAPIVKVEVGMPVRYAAVEIERIGDVYTSSPVLLRFAIGAETKLF